MMEEEMEEIKEKLCVCIHTHIDIYRERERENMREGLVLHLVSRS